MLGQSINRKNTAWITGVIAGLALISGVGAIMASFMRPDWAPVPFVTILMQMVQVVVSIIAAVGSVLLYRGQRIGRTILLFIVSALILVASVNVLLYLIEENDFLFATSSMLLHLFPLVFLIVLLLKTRMEASTK